MTPATTPYVKARTRCRCHSPACGSYEVHVEGQQSRYFYFEDLPGRRLRSEQLTREQALEQAQLRTH